MHMTPIPMLPQIMSGRRPAFSISASATQRKPHLKIPKPTLHKPD